MERWLTGVSLVPERQHQSGLPRTMSADPSRFHGLLERSVIAALSMTVAGMRSPAVVPAVMMVGFAVRLTVRTVCAALVTPPTTSDDALRTQVAFVPHTRSATVPSASCARMVAPPAGAVIVSLNAILTTSPESRLVVKPTFVVTRASSDVGGPTGVGGFATVAGLPYPNAAVLVTGLVAPTR